MDADIPLIEISWILTFYIIILKLTRDLRKKERGGLTVICLYAKSTGSEVSWLTTW